MIADASPAEKRVFQRDYISWSAISTYQQCPLRFYFRYVAGLEETFVSASLVLGGAIHKAIEFHFNQLLAGKPAPEQDLLLAKFWEEWHQRADATEIRFGKNENLDGIARTADRMLAAFRESESACPGGDILSVEEELREQLVPGLPEVLGRLDLLLNAGDTLTVIDFKTSRSRWSREQAVQAGDQLRLYSELVRSLIPGKRMRLQFVVLTKGAKPAVDQVSVSVDSQRIQRTKRLLQSAWQAVKAQHFFPSPSPMSCPACPFRGPCSRWPGN